MLAVPQDAHVCGWLLIKRHSTGENRRSCAPRPARCGSFMKYHAITVMVMQSHDAGHVRHAGAHGQVRVGSSGANALAMSSHGIP